VVDRLLQESLDRGETRFISDPVLCELEWVLSGLYRVRRAEFLEIFQDLLADDLFDFEDRGVVREALDACRKGKAEFSDYLIGAKGVARGARVTYTFDRDLRGREGFSVL
jgi:predicted nucleic-acid-binding protein